MEQNKTNIKTTDSINQIYDEIEQNKRKYEQLMSGDDAVKNAVKFNRELNKRMEKLGIKTRQYIPKESNDAED